MERIFKKSLALILTLVLALNTAGCVQRPGTPQPVNPAKNPVRPDQNTLHGSILIFRNG